MVAAFFFNPILVRELVGWVRNVVLMNVYLGLENPGVSGFRVGGHMG
jgi:energy-converting hydrogenase Eha subunit B